MAKRAPVGSDEEDAAGAVDDADPEAQRQRVVRRIEATFVDASRAPVHPTRPSLAVESIAPVLPDFDHWALSYVLGQFDGPPLPPAAAAAPEAAEMARQALLLVRQHAGRPFMQYHVPGADGIADRKRRRAENRAAPDQCVGVFWCFFF